MTSPTTYTVTAKRGHAEFRQHGLSKSRAKAVAAKLDANGYEAIDVMAENEAVSCTIIAVCAAGIALAAAGAVVMAVVYAVVRAAAVWMAR